MHHAPHCLLECLYYPTVASSKESYLRIDASNDILKNVHPFPQLQRKSVITRSDANVRWSPLFSTLKNKQTANLLWRKYSPNKAPICYLLLVILQTLLKFSVNMTKNHSIPSICLTHLYHVALALTNLRGDILNTHMRNPVWEWTFSDESLKLIPLKYFVFLG